MNEQAMTQAVTHADILRAWHVMFAREPEFAHIPVTEPNLDDKWDRRLWESLRQILEADRRARGNG